MSESFPIKRLETESAKAFEAFVIYAEMGLERTLEKAYNSTVDREKIDGSKRSHWEKWSRENDWKLRSREYDDWVFNKQQEDKLWLRRRTLAAIGDRLETSLSQDLSLAEVLTGRLKKLIETNDMNPLIFKNLCTAFKDISVSKVKILDAYFSCLGGEAIAQKIIDETKKEL
jgi:hypothetical protein